MSKLLCLYLSGFALFMRIGWAQVGAPLAGTFALSNIAEGRETVHATFALRLVNPLERRIEGARVVVATGLGEQLVAPCLTLEAGGHEAIRAELVVSRTEYRRWQRGGLPKVSVEFAGPAAGLVKMPASLVRARVGK